MGVVFAGVECFFERHRPESRENLEPGTISTTELLGERACRDLFVAQNFDEQTAGEACTVHRPNAILSGCVTGGVLAFQATNLRCQNPPQTESFPDVSAVRRCKGGPTGMALGCAGFAAFSGVRSLGSRSTAEHPSMSSSSGYRDPDGSLSSCSVNASWVNRDVAIRSASKKASASTAHRPESSSEMVNMQGLQLEGMHPPCSPTRSEKQLSDVYSPMYAATLYSTRHGLGDGSPGAWAEAFYNRRCSRHSQGLVIHSLFSAQICIAVLLGTCNKVVGGSMIENRGGESSNTKSSTSAWFAALLLACFKRLSNAF